MLILRQSCIACANENSYKFINESLQQYNYDRYYAKTIENNTNALQNKTEKELSLIAASYVIIDYRDNHILTGNNYNEELSIASTTKILTALLALETASLDDIITISDNAASQPKVRLGMAEGEKYYMKDLIYAMMLGSYNDVAVAIAEHIGITTDGFAKLMNEKAVSIGACNSSFVTPNGLDAENHYSTAYDISIIASYAMKNPKFRDIVANSQYSFNEITSSKSFVVSNINKYLYQNDNAIGIKTGFTGKAGYCFVGGTEFEGTVLISTVLASGWPPNSSYKWKDTEKIVQFVYDNYNNRILKIPSWEIPDFDGTTIEIKEYILEYLSDGEETVTEVLHIYATNDELLKGCSYEAYIKYDNVKLDITGYITIDENTIK